MVQFSCSSFATLQVSIWGFEHFRYSTWRQLTENLLLIHLWQLAFKDSAPLHQGIFLILCQRMVVWICHRPAWQQDLFSLYSYFKTSVIDEKHMHTQNPLFFRNSFILTKYFSIKILFKSGLKVSWVAFLLLLFCFVLLDLFVSFLNVVLLGIKGGFIFFFAGNWKFPPSHQPYFFLYGVEEIYFTEVS